MSERAELKPCVVAALENFDYPTRVAALRILGSGNGIDAAIDDSIADPQMLRAVLTCLSHMAWAGLLEYYGGWDEESAGWTLSREHSLAEDLANIETEFHEGATQLNFSKPDPHQAELLAARAECAAILFDTLEIREQYAQQVAKLPPGIYPTLAGWPCCAGVTTTRAAIPPSAGAAVVAQRFTRSTTPTCFVVAKPARICRAASTASGESG